MKKTINFTIIIAIIAMISWVGLYFVADKGVEMNPIIEQHLKEEYKTENISKRFVLSIEVLDLSHKNLTSIEGLEAFTNLQELNVSGNLLTDATPIAELEQLTSLDLSFNQLTELTLASDQLKKLDVEANRLSTIEFASKLPHLQNLNLRANNVVDLTPLQSLKNLQKLNIRGNQVKTVEPLENLTKLMDLNAQNNQITFVEPIAHLPLEKRLYLLGNELQDLEVFADRLDTFDDYDFEIPIPKPTFRMKSGVYTEPISVELRTAKAHKIFYTLDGSMPTAKSERYKKPIELTKEMMFEQPINANTQTSIQRDGFNFKPEDVKKAITITAASYQSGKFGEPVSQTYILTDDLVTGDLPILSLIVPPKDLFDEDGGIYVPGNMYEEGYTNTGNYHQRGRAHEKKGSLEYFNEEGKPTFHQTIGVRINGSYTRMLPQKSLRIYPRSEYGQSRIYSKIFEDLPYYEFNQLVLRSSGNDNDSTLLRDGLMHELVKDRSVDVQAYQPAIVLLNGEYWGIHNIREKFTDDYIDIKYNVKKSDLVMMTLYKKSGRFHFKMDSGIEKDRLHYDEMLGYIRTNDMRKEEHIDYVNTQMDIENFLEYVAYQAYYGNTDSFSNNLTVWRKKGDYIPDAPRGHDGRWRWMLFDLDWGMGYGVLGQKGVDPMTYNMLDVLTSDEEEVELFKLLTENQTIQDRFTEIMLTLLNDNFKSDTVQEKIDALAAKIRPEIPRSIQRWENIESVEAWEENINVLYDFAAKRPDIVRKQLQETFGYTEDELKEIESAIIE